MVSVEEDPISRFFDTSDAPQVLNLPIELDPITEQVKRVETSFNLESFFDDYD